MDYLQFVEFEKARCVSEYSFPNPYVLYASSYYTPFWCDICSSSDHNIFSCPIYARYSELDSSFPLAQCMRLEVGEPFGFITRLNAVDLYCQSEDTYYVMHNLVKTPLEVSCDVYVHEEYFSIGCNNVHSNPLDHSNVSLMCSQPFSFPEY